MAHAKIKIRCILNLVHEIIERHKFHGEKFKMFCLRISELEIVKY